MDQETKTGKDRAMPDDLARHHEVAKGLVYLHARTNATAGRTLEAASFVYALIELLAEKGLLDLAEIDTRKKEVAQRLLKRFMQQDPGVSLQEPEQDKYTFPQTAAIDCESRVHLCKAACCKMVFPLSRQDIEEGVIRWELSQPYVITRIWLDFENKIVNPKLNEPNWPHNLSAEEMELPGSEIQ